MNICLSIRILLATSLLTVSSALAQDHDIVILNGRVMDPETNFDGVRNVGIKDGKIVAITKDAIKGKETIDAKGHVVAPGFIEGHQHATDPFSRKVNLRDGLTTQMDFEAGAGDIAKWYANAEGKTQSNYGMVVLATLARVSVLDGPEIAAGGNDMGELFRSVVKDAAAKAQKEGRKPGWSSTLPNKEEMTKIMSLVDEGLRQGALGVGVPVGYMTTGVTQYELYKYQELAGKYGRITNGHVRFAGVRPPTEGQLGVQEMLANAMVLDAPFMASHLNSNMDWEYTIPLVNDAREKRGAKVWGEVYPYATGSTIASTDILTAGSMAQMGITYSDVSNLDGTRWDEAMYEDIRKNDPGRAIVIYNNPEKDIGKWLAMPGVVIVSDGMAIQDENLTRYTLGTDTTENNGAQELVANALALGAPAIVLHFNNPGWRLAHEMITGLQAQGHNIWGEIYPYAAGSTTLNASFLQPDSWIEDLGNKYEDTLQDPITGKFYTLETYNADVTSDPTKPIVMFKMPAEDAPKWLTLKGVTMASDAVGAEPLLGPWDFPLEELGNTHPRTVGSRGATIRMGREHNIPMMQLMSILSYNAAKHDEEANKRLTPFPDYCDHFFDDAATGVGLFSTCVENRERDVHYCTQHGLGRPRPGHRSLGFPARHSAEWRWQRECADMDFEIRVRHRVVLWYRIGGWSERERSALRPFCAAFIRPEPSSAMSVT